MLMHSRCVHADHSWFLSFPYVAHSHPLIPLLLLLQGAADSEAELERLVTDLLQAQGLGDDNGSGDPSGGVPGPTSSRAQDRSIAPAPGAGPIPYRLARGGSAAIVQQRTLFPLGEFVKMRSTEYAWHLAFPTVFRPRYVDGKWIIPGDPTGWHVPRDKKVRYTEWHKWLMWRDDGIPAKHPTFSLVVNNDQQREALQGQGRAALYVDSNFDETITAEEFLRQWQSEENGQASIRSRLLHFAGNVRGTDQYWNR